MSICTQMDLQPHLIRLRLPIQANCLSARHVEDEIEAVDGILAQLIAGGTSKELIILIPNL